MHGTCPNCSARLNDFAFNCNRCGWSLDAQIQSSTSQASTSQASTAAPGKRDQPGLDDMPTENELLVERATADIEKEKYESAIKFLNRAIIDATPERLGELYALRGYSYLKHGQFAAAETDCTRAIERFWVEPQSFAWRAAARGEQGKWRLAFDDLARACDVAGDQRDPYLQLMQSYSDAASEHFREMIKAGRDNADMFFERGWIYYRLERFDRAVRDFNLALEQDAGHANAALGLAKARFENKIPDRAGLKEVIGLCDIAIRSTDEECQLEALSIRARANYSFGHYARASKDLAALSEKCKGDAARMVLCGELRQQLDQHIEAISDLSGALDLDANNYEARRKRGDSYFAIRNYSLAIDDYSRFLRAFPDDTATRVKRGQAYQRFNRPDLSLQDFDRVLTLDRSNVNAFLGRARIFTRRNKLDLALSECEKAVRLDNRNHEAFSALADIYVGLCDYSRAIEEFSRAIRLAPGDEEKADCLYRRGTSQYELKQFREAADDFQESLKLREHHAGTWIWNSAACSQLEDWPGAILSLQKAISMRPSMADRYLSLGKPVARRAVEFFRHELQRGKSTASTYRSLGLAWHFLGEHKQAIENYTKAIELEPNDNETLMRRGQAFAKEGDPTAANEDFTVIIRRDANDHRARYHRAAARMAAGRNRVALMDVTKAIKLFPGDPVYHTLHGDLLQKPDATGKSINQIKIIRAYDRALRIDSSNPETLRKRANANMYADLFLNAVDDFTRALELDPSRTDILVQRGNANLKSRQFDHALTDFELALTRDNRIAKAYSGRAAALTAKGRHEYALIWLTKALHRFDNARDLAEILFSRAKTFYAMARFRPAINDFNSVIDLLRADPRAQIATRIGRAIAWIQLEQWKNASDDFRSVLKYNPDNNAAQVGSDWLDDLSSPRPEMFASPPELIRPTKPRVVTSELEQHEIDESWAALPPFDSWILRIRSTSDSEHEVKEYGPVSKRMLESWAAEGRINYGMKLLRADWSKWENAERILPALAQKKEQENAFPGIQLRRPAAPRTESAPADDS